ncbi:MAG TPA: tetratricopeptide repeat protein [Bacteroidia bacterium]|nr:tetratricopeptide repeat protein [Bacteroidia bacterium]
MQQLIFILVLIGTQAVSTYASNPLFDTAIKAYNSKEYDKSCELFESLLSKDGPNEVLLYNLGNAYYKSGHFAQAIVQYERVLRLNPNHQDAIANLNFVNNQTTDRIESTPQVFYVRWFNSFLYSLNPGQWMNLSIALIWLALICGSVFILASNISLRKPAFVLLLILGFTSLITLTCSQLLQKKLDAKSHAIVNVLSTYVYSSPDEKSTSLFMLHEGTKAELLDDLTGWYKIKLSNGTTGWIKQNALEII